MKSIKMTLAAIALSTLSVSAFAAQQVESTPAQQQPAGVVSAQVNSSNLSALEAKLAAKAEAAGAKSYRITSASGNNTLFGTAEIYN
ncbi:hypothetical protein CIG19_02795 [Enterobacterales bacterium CwR94]|nr:hypothetical protein CIG19_02795 [Enterobacterales bacterium CwR94]